MPKKKVNGLNAMESPRLYIFRIKETTLFMPNFRSSSVIYSVF